MGRVSIDHSASGVIPYGFRGDPFLLYTVDNLIHQAGMTTFVETGSFYGATVHYVAQNYPTLMCYSCEPNEESFFCARSTTAKLPNCQVSQEDSPQLLHRLAKTEVVHTPTLFWLDAHGYGFDWPLRAEIEIITKYWVQPYILIDDLRVPGHPWFGWDEYGTQECSYRYISDLLAARPHHVWYPNYPAKLVTSWPMRGWGLIIFTPYTWTADQWLIPRSEIEVASITGDRAGQEEYWYGVLDEVEHLAISGKADDVRDTWHRLAQQAPNWAIPEVARRLSTTNYLLNSTAWLICIRRLASLGEVAQTLDLLSRLPMDSAEQSLHLFSDALSPNLRLAAMRHIEEQHLNPSWVAILNKRRR